MFARTGGAAVKWFHRTATSQGENHETSIQISCDPSGSRVVDLVVVDVFGQHHCLDGQLQPLGLVA
jgi:hypothetical protein